MAAEVARALVGSAPSLPSKYFYDDRGSRLFDEITRQPEYYQTRTEFALLERHADLIAERIRPAELFELGSGVGRKIRLLIDAARRRGRLKSCVLFDINAAFLDASVARLQRAYPDLDVRGVQGDLLRDLERAGSCPARLAVFLAGTLGNLHPDAVPPFMNRVRSLVVPDGGFLVGIDLVKDKATLEAAYNDAAGVTRDFNLNILRVMNRELGADFDVDGFEHRAFFDEENAWIEMRLRCTDGQTVSLDAADMSIDLAPGDEIRTEISCKYTRESFAERLEGTGLSVREWLQDDEGLFALVLLQP